MKIFFSLVASICLCAACSNFNSVTTQNSETKPVSLHITDTNNMTTLAFEDYLKEVRTVLGYQFKDLYVINRGTGDIEDTLSLDLPFSISGTALHLVSEQEAEALKSTFDSTKACLNLVLDLGPKDFQFQTFTFFNTWNYQFSYNSRYKAIGDSIVCQVRNIEQLMRNEKGAPSYYKVYMNGVFLREQSINQI